MKCLVCSVTWEDAKGPQCPQCRYDQSAPDAKDQAKLNAARARFREATTAYAPDSRVTTWDKWRPWAGLALGLVFALLWWRACQAGLPF